MVRTQPFNSIPEMPSLLTLPSNLNDLPLLTAREWICTKLINTLLLCTLLNEMALPWIAFPIGKVLILWAICLVLFPSSFHVPPWLCYLSHHLFLSPCSVTQIIQSTLNLISIIKGSMKTSIIYGIFAILTDAILSSLHLVTHLILTTTLWGVYHSYPYHTHEKPNITYFPALSESNKLMDALAKCKTWQIWALVINSFFWLHYSTQ